MAYPKKQLRLRPRKGVASDVPAWSTPGDVFTQADNILFRQGLAERAPSTTLVYDPPSVAPYGLLNAQIAGTNYWIYAGASTTYAVEGSTHTDITHASGLQTVPYTSRISLGLLNGVPFFNNSLDEPQYWDGNIGNNFVDLPDWTATESCRFMVAHRFHLFAFNISGPSGDFTNQVKWSDAAAPGNVPSSWTPSASNEAGSTTLSDTPGELVSAANLRGSLMIYKNGSTHIADYIGGNEIFGFRTLFVQSGALTRHSVADVNGQHFVVTDGDIILTDGQSVRSIAQNRRKRFLFNALDQDNFENLFCVYYRQQNEVWLCFPEAGNTFANRAMVYNLATDSWGDRELPGVTFGATGVISDSTPDETWNSDSDAWDTDLTEWNRQSYSLATQDLVLSNATDTEFLEVGRGTETLTSTLAKHDLDFGEPERLKFIKRVHVRVEADTSISFSVRIGTRNATGESVSWTASTTLNSDDGFVNVLAIGKYISVEIAATTDTTFKITGLELEAEIRGYH